MKGWTKDVYECIKKLPYNPTTLFTLSELYAFESHLHKLHPDNNNIKPKIRQQMQVLRDKGLLKFNEDGTYTLIEGK